MKLIRFRIPFDVDPMPADDHAEMAQATDEEIQLTIQTSTQSQFERGNVDSVTGGEFHVV